MNEEPLFKADLVEENTPAASQAVEPKKIRLWPFWEVCFSLLLSTRSKKRYKPLLS